MTQLNQDQLREKLPKIAAALATATGQGCISQTDQWPHYIELRSIRLMFEPTRLIRQKHRHVCKWQVWDGEEWESFEFLRGKIWPEIGLNKSPKAIAQDLQRRILPDVRADLVQRQRWREHYTRDRALKKATLQNCLNAAGERNGHMKDYKGYEPAIYGEIAGAKFNAECVHNRPDRVNIRLENLTQACAEKVLAMVQLSQPQDNADNL